MGQIAHIRRHVFGVSQAALAAIAGVTQATVSRWESGDSEPTRAEMARIRSEAMTRGFEWDDRWFFDPPPPADAPSPAPEPAREVAP